MNRLGNQFFSCTRFALNQHGGIGRCNSLNLFEPRFQCRALAYNSRELALSLLLFANPNCLRALHNYPPNQPRYFNPLLTTQFFKAVRTLSSSTASSKGFARNFTAPPLIACSRILSSPCALMKMVGIAQ